MYFHFIDMNHFKLTLFISSCKVNAHNEFSEYINQKSPADSFDTLRNLKRLPSSHENEINLEFEVFNTSYLMELEPSNDLIHEKAQVDIVSSEGSVENTHLDAETMGIYKGTLYHAETGSKLNKDKNPSGWARIVFHSDVKNEEEEVLFEGTLFSPQLGFHHVSTFKTVRLKKRDFNMSSSLTPEQQQYQMMAFKESFSKSLDKNMVSQCGNTQNSHMTKFSLEEFDILRATWGFDMSILNQTANLLGKQSIFENLNLTSHNITSRSRLQRRQQPAQDNGCPKDTMIIYMGVASDCSYTQLHGGSTGALKQILQNWNSVSQIFQSSFNIAVGLVSVKIMNECGDHKDKGESFPLNWNKPCSSDYSIKSRLSDFSEWRGRKNQDNIGLWHLMTKCPSGVSVGIAWRDQICKAELSQDNEGSWISSAGVSSANSEFEWKVVAHEVAHNFGAVHDCSDSDCPATCSDISNCQCCPCGPGPQCSCSNNYIMSSTDNSKSNTFSPCSIKTVCGLLASRPSCLMKIDDPPPKAPVKANVCGNGVKEEGEDCDCGDNCDQNSCCDGKTCKFKNGAKCDDLNDACCHNCQIKEKGAVCRKSMGICDYDEICDGVSAQCPKDGTLKDGSSCNDPKLSKSLGQTFCASGTCTNRNLQCKSFLNTQNITGECADFSTECNLNCLNTKNQCLRLPGKYLDGTRCGNDGICMQGICQRTTFAGQLTAWYTESPGIAIPVTVAVSIILILIIIYLIRCIGLRKEAKRKSEKRKKEIDHDQKSYPPFSDSDLKEEDEAYSFDRRSSLYKEYTESHPQQSEERYVEEEGPFRNQWNRISTFYQKQVVGRMR